MITPSGLLLLDGRPPSTYAPTNLGEAHRLAKYFGLRQLWYSADAMRAIGLPQEPELGAWAHPFLEAPGLKTPPRQVGLTHWLSVWGEDHYVEVSLPRWDAGGPFYEAAEFDYLLLGEVAEFVSATGGMLWRRSGAITSDAWLREHYRDLPETEQPELELDRDFEADAHYFERADGKARFCHAFDGNALYLGAMSSLPLGVGELSHWRLGQAERRPSKELPGYWLVNDRYVTTPTFAHQFDPNPRATTLEVHYWREVHRYLEPFYRTLRDARTQLIESDPQSAALAAVKQVYSHGVGRLGSRERTREHDPLYQPYWRYAVRSEARERLSRRVEKLTQRPVAIEVDCLYFLTSAADPLRFAERIGLPIGSAIGQFKWYGTMPGKVARDILRDSTRAKQALLALGRELVDEPEAARDMGVVI